jgi:hypothetical protein
MASLMSLSSTFFGSIKSLRAGVRKRYSPYHLSALDSCIYRLMKLGRVAVPLEWTPLRLTRTSKNYLPWLF